MSTLEAQILCDRFDVPTPLLPGRRSNRGVQPEKLRTFIRRIRLTIQRGVLKVVFGGRFEGRSGLVEVNLGWVAQKSCVKTLKLDFPCRDLLLVFCYFRSTRTDVYWNKMVL